jgi:hypothetical protein
VRAGGSGVDRGTTGARTGASGFDRDASSARSFEDGARTRPNDADSLRGDDRILPRNGGMGDVERELHLGGDGDRSGLPRDLPVAGSGTYDLPVGRLPVDHMLPIPTAGQGSSALPTDDLALPLSGGTSMFPFLDPASEPPSTEAVPARPRLDRPEALP